MDEESKKKEELGPTPLERKPFFFDSLTIHCDKTLKKRFVDFANEVYGGRQYVALSQLMDWYYESRHISNLIANQQALEEELEELKKKLSIIEGRVIEAEPKKRKTVMTMGGHELEDVI